MRETYPMTTPELPTPDAEQVEPPKYRVRPRRRGGSALDMVRSLGLVGLAVIGMVAFSLWNRPTHPPVSPDISATVQAARANAAFPVLAMTTLPEGWYANAARYGSQQATNNPPTYHLGYVTQDEHYFGVDTMAGAVSIVDKILREESITGLTFAVTADGDSQRWISINTAATGSTIVLTGSGTREQWQQFTSALSAEGPIAL
jgi:hypothetical protein